MASVLERFDLRGLGHHRAQQAAIQLNGAVLELVAAPTIAVERPIGERKAPSGEHAVNIVAYPCVTVVAVNRYRSARGEQPRHGVLFIDNQGRYFAKVRVELGP